MPLKCVIILGISISHIKRCIHGVQIVDSMLLSSPRGDLYATDWALTQRNITHSARIACLELMGLINTLLVHTGPMLGDLRAS